MSEEKKEPIKMSENESLQLLLQKNLEHSEEILKLSRQIKSFIRWQQAWGLIRLLIIIVPIVLGFIYLPPLIKEAMESYKSLFSLRRF